MDFAVAAKMAKYAGLLNSKPSEISDDKVVEILQDFGIAKAVNLEQVSTIRGLLKEADIESLAQLMTSPGMLDKLRGVFLPKDGRPVVKDNVLTGQVIHQCGHCKSFNLVPFTVEMG